MSSSEEENDFMVSSDEFYDERPQGAVQSRGSNERNAKDRNTISVDPPLYVSDAFTDSHPDQGCQEGMTTTREMSRATFHTQTTAIKGKAVEIQ